MMTHTIPNRQVICDVLIEEAENDKDIVVLCSDSRGSSSMAAFAKRFPEQFIEVGIAEQNLVSIAAGMARCGKKPFVASPASFLSTRSLEQIKVDVAYSGTNVKLVGVSGGISYGALGLTHHSVNDIAALASLPGTRVYIPSDKFLTKYLCKYLVKDTKNAYIRVGRNASADVYSENSPPLAGGVGGGANFVLNKAITITEGSDIALIACGDMVRPALDAGIMLKEKGISATVIDMYCLKPIDRDAIIKAAQTHKAIITIEEQSIYGGLGAMVSQITANECPIKVINMGLPDEPVIAGKPEEVFAHYGLTAEGIVKKVKNVYSSPFGIKCDSIFSWVGAKP
ncbi:MAG: hypothetical protein LBM77_00655 [Spirochaetaceae bacterium]|jgi:transketolase|nr:hypothetical protein [Spirochaetaceae bacterium]